MQLHGHAHMVLLRRLVIALVIALVVGFALTVYYEASVIEQHAIVTHPEAVPPAPTPYPPRGRRWFFEYPLWQQPEQQP